MSEIRKEADKLTDVWVVYKDKVEFLTDEIQWYRKRQGREEEELRKLKKLK